MTAKEHAHKTHVAKLDALDKAIRKTYERILDLDIERATLAEEMEAMKTKRDKLSAQPPKRWLK